MTEYWNGNFRLDIGGFKRQVFDFDIKTNFVEPTTMLCSFTIEAEKEKDISQQIKANDLFTFYIFRNDGANLIGFKYYQIKIGQIIGSEQAVSLSYDSSNIIIYEKLNFDKCTISKNGFRTLLTPIAPEKFTEVSFDKEIDTLLGRRG